MCHVHLLYLRLLVRHIGLQQANSVYVCCKLSQTCPRCKPKRTPAVGRPEHTGLLPTPTATYHRHFVDSFDSFNSDVNEPPFSRLFQKRHSRTVLKSVDFYNSDIQEPPSNQLLQNPRHKSTFSRLFQQRRPRTKLWSTLSKC